MVSTYTSYRLYTQDLGKALRRTAAEPQVARDEKYYQENIGRVTSVDDFLGDHRLFTFAMKAYGLEDMTYAKAFMRKVLESDLGDPASFANKLADKRYREFAAAFNFEADGSVADAADIQADDQENDTIELYTVRNAALASAAEAETTYFENHIGAVTSVDDLMGDSRLYRYALQSVGFDPDRMSRTAIRAVLTSDLADPNSTANRYGGVYLELANAFNFATDGSVLSGYTAQSAAQTATMVSLYGSRDDAGLSDLQASVRSAYYRNNIDRVTSVDELLRNDTLSAYMRIAYGIGSSVSLATIRKALTSDLSDPNSFVNRLGDDRLAALAAAFNFAADGSVATRRLVQSIEGAARTVVRHQATIDATDAVAARAEAKETAYYKATIGAVASLDAFLDDGRLEAYVLTAYGLAGDRLSDATLRKILTSDLADPKSYANRTADGRYRELAAAFNFDGDGTIEREAARHAQSKKSAITTTDMYTRQTMESEAGDQNEGVRLALYFARKASSLTSAYDILGDKALLKVVQTAFGLAETTAMADVDVQAAMIEKRLDLDDLKDEVKLNKFLVRFCAMYDLETVDGSTSPTAILFGNAGTTGFDQTLVSSLQTLLRSKL